MYRSTEYVVRRSEEKGMQVIIRTGSGHGLGLWSLMDALQSVLKFCKQFKSGPLGNNAFLFFISP